LLQSASMRARAQSEVKYSFSPAQQRGIARICFYRDALKGIPRRARTDATIARLQPEVATRRLAQSRAAARKERNARKKRARAAPIARVVSKNGFVRALFDKAFTASRDVHTSRKTCWTENSVLRCFAAGAIALQRFVPRIHDRERKREREREKERGGWWVAYFFLAFPRRAIHKIGHKLRAGRSIFRP